VLVAGAAFAAFALVPGDSNAVRPSSFSQRLAERLRIEPPPTDIPVIRLRMHDRLMSARLRYPGPSPEEQRAVSAFINGGRDGNGSNAQQLIAVRTLQMLAEVAVNFGKDEIVVIDSYRPSAGYHTRGTAIDFRVPGVDNGALYNYCLTFNRDGYHAGCGYFGATNYIHMDYREEQAQWCDCSGGGEPSRNCTPEEKGDIAARHGVRCPGYSQGR
jgi:hypothetical protein